METNRQTSFNHHWSQSGVIPNFEGLGSDDAGEYEEEEIIEAGHRVLQHFEEESALTPGEKELIGGEEGDGQLQAPLFFGEIQQSYPELTINVSHVRIAILILTGLLALILYLSFGKPVTRQPGAPDLLKAPITAGVYGEVEVQKESLMVLLLVAILEVIRKSEAA